MENLEIYCFQYDIAWQNPQANFARLSSLIEDMNPKKESLLLLPEMFSTGFSMNAKEFAEHHPGAAVQWMRREAARYNCFVAGSVMTTEKENYYNRLYVVGPNGAFSFYDKHQLFTYSGENLTYASGNRHLVVDVFGFRVAFYVCYDLRFPEWCRNTKALNYDLAVFVANWPAVRSGAWQQLLRARAIENRCYVAGVNRIGKDGNGLEYNGCSAIIDFEGVVLQEEINHEKVLHSRISLSALKEAREKFPVLVDQSNFTIHE